ncbi:MAG: DUF6152 family protein [Pseudomonadota bacterium]|nr:DUF6152 family protein [Pseudomonadota bacterium]
MKIVKALTGLLLALTASAALAHHSAVMFDFQNTVVVEGKVKEVRFANPHMKLVLEVTDAKGTRDIEFEGHSRNNMARQGLTPNLFKVDDTIAIRIAPMRNGEDGGYVTAVRGPDGTEVGRVTGAD